MCILILTLTSLPVSLFFFYKDAPEYYHLSCSHYQLCNHGNNLQLGLLNGPILLVGKQKQQDFTRSRGASLGWQSSDLTCCQKACQFHSTLNRHHTDTATECGPCQFTPLYNIHSHPILEGERAKELCESNFVRKPLIFPFLACMTVIIAKKTDERWLINSDLLFSTVIRTCSLPTFWFSLTHKALAFLPFSYVLLCSL